MKYGNIQNHINWQIMRPMLPVFVLFNLHGMLGCAKQKVTDNRTPANVDSAADAKSAEDMVKGKEIAFTGFPDWCSANPQPDNTTCIVCEKTTDSNAKASLANLCFKPRADFDPKIHCGLSNTSVGVKTLSCHAADKDYTTDVSLPVDKAISVLSAALVAFKNAVPELYKDDTVSATVATGVVEYFNTNAVKVLSSKDQVENAGIFVDLINQFLVTPYDAAGKTTLKTQVAAKMVTLHDAFAGTGTFEANKLFTAIFDIAKLIPKEKLGKASDVLTPEGLSKIIESRKADLDPIIAKWAGNNVGISSSDDLIKQIKLP